MIILVNSKRRGPLLTRYRLWIISYFSMYNYIFKLASIFRKFADSTCPSCGNPKAYIGLNEVECPDQDCDFFSEKQAEYVREEGQKEGHDDDDLMGKLDHALLEIYKGNSEKEIVGNYTIRLSTKFQDLQIVDNTNGAMVAKNITPNTTPQFLYNKIKAYEERQKELYSDDLIDVGDRVKITETSRGFYGYTGEVVNINSDGTADVSVLVFGRPAKITVDLNRLRNLVK